MGCSEGSGGSAPRNLRYFRAALVAVRPSRTTGTIVVEVVDQIGDGFAAEFSQVLAIDAVMKVIGGVGRLRGWDDQT